MKPQHHLPALLRLPDVLKITGMSSTMLYRLAAEGRFPKPLKLSERSSAWVESEVRAWVNTRIAERDKGRIGAGRIPGDHTERCAKAEAKRSGGEAA